MDHRVLITGIDGFTGKHLERYLLAKGYDVYGTLLHPDGNDKHLVCDLRNFNKVTLTCKQVKPNYVIHLAAISFVGETNLSLILDVNVIGTENLLRALSEISVHKVILASSATVYGNQELHILDESMCPRPLNHYGISKLAMEHLAASYFQTLPIIIIRPFNYTGIEQAEHFLIPKIVSHFKRRDKTIELGNLDVAREFNDVRDVVEIYHRLMTSDLESETFNLCTSNAIRLLDVIDILNQMAGYEIEVSVNPKFVRANEIKMLKGSNHKLVNALDIPDFRLLKETLAWMYQS